MEAESFSSRSTRFIPSRQLPATNRAAHQTMGKGRSHTHQKFFSVAIPLKRHPPFLHSRKIKQCRRSCRLLPSFFNKTKKSRSRREKNPKDSGQRSLLHFISFRYTPVFRADELYEKTVNAAAASISRKIGVSHPVQGQRGVLVFFVAQVQLALWSSEGFVHKCLQFFEHFQADRSPRALKCFDQYVPVPVGHFHQPLPCHGDSLPSGI